MVTMRQYLSRVAYEQKKRYQMWEIARWEKYIDINLSPNIKPEHKPKRPEDVLRLPTDTPKVVNKVEITQSDIDILKNIGLFNKESN